MPWKVGSIVGDAELNTSNWEQGAGRLLKSIGGMALAVKAGSALWNAFKDSINAADEWQKSLSNVNTLLDSSVVNSQEMAYSLLALDPALGSTIELTDAMYQSFSAGAESMEEALDITVDAATFARAALTDTATAVDVLTTAQNAYGREVVTTEQAADIFFTTIKQGKINGEQLASVIGKSIPLFASLQIPLEELGAGMAAMTKQGVNAAEATTQLNAIVNSFIKPSASMKEALEAAGIASGSALLETEGLSGALEFLQNSTAGNKEALSELLPSIEAVRGALALTGVGGEEFAAILEEMENAQGATQTAFEKQELTFETYRNQMAKTQLVLGNIGKSFVDEIAEGATEASKSMLSFLMSAQGAELVSNTVGTLGATFHFLKALLQPLVETLLPVLGDIFTTTGEAVAELTSETGEGVGVMDLLSSALQLTSSAIKIFGAMTTGAITNIVNLISVLREAGQTLGTFFQLISREKTWDDVKNQLADTWDAVKGFGEGFADGFSNIADTVIGEVVTLSDRVDETTNALNSSVVISFQEAKNGVLENWDELLTGQQDFTEGYEEQQEQFLAQLEAQRQSEANSQQEHYDNLLKQLSDYIDRDEEETLESYEEKLEALEELLDAKQIKEEEYEEAVKELRKEKNAEAYDEFMNYWDLVTQGATKAIDYLQDYYDSAKDSELSKAKETYDAQLEALKERNKSGEINDIEYARRKEELEKQKLAKENEIKKKQFENNKAWSIVNIWLDAAAGAMNAWANNDWVTALIITGLVAAEAVAATATVASQEFTPSRQQGGKASGMTNMNEAGAESVILPDGSVVVPADITRKVEDSVGKSGATIININNPIVREESDIDKIAAKVEKVVVKKLRSA